MGAREKGDDGAGSRLGRAEGFSWSGKLDEVPIHALYATLQAVRFSGRLELDDGQHHAQIAFLGGDPIDIRGGDTQQIALWAHGTFRAMQLIPSFGGDLVDSHQMEGELGRITAASLWAWVGEYRLTCEIAIERPNEQARMVFRHGKLESASVNGEPELAALARLSAWDTGRFGARLLPLFEQVPALQAPVPEGAPPPNPRQFDISRSIPVDLRNKPASPFPPLASRGEGGKSADDRYMLTAPVPQQARSSPFLWALALFSLALCGAAVGLYVLKLPPFSHPAEAPPLAQAPDLARALEPEAPPAASTGAGAPDGSSDEVAAEAGRPAGRPAAEPDPAAEAKPQPDPEGPEAPPLPDRAQRLVQKARTLLIEGHEHTALEVLQKAEKLAPNHPLLAIYQQQALGKLGRVELFLDGKGAITIDGHRFSPPRKLKIPAGPHVVDLGEGPTEMSLHRGDRVHLKAAK